MQLHRENEDKGSMMIHIGRMLGLSSLGKKLKENITDLHRCLKVRGPRIKYSS